MKQVDLDALEKICKAKEKTDEVYAVKLTVQDFGDLIFRVSWAPVFSAFIAQPVHYVDGEGWYTIKVGGSKEILQQIEDFFKTRFGIEQLLGMDQCAPTKVSEKMPTLRMI